MPELAHVADFVNRAERAFFRPMNIQTTKGCSVIHLYNVNDVISHLDIPTSGTPNKYVHIALTERLANL